MVFIIPPFQSPDEFNHFYRIYQITEGKFVGEFNADSSQLGGYAPKSFTTISKQFDEPMALKSDFKVFKNALKMSWNVPLNRNDTVFINFPNTARYAPTAYLPQVVTFLGLKIFNLKPLIMLYGGRIATFLTWLFLVTLAVCLTPVFKELFMLFLILPASLSINSTLNADIFTNALVFIVFAYFFCFRERTKIKSLELILFSVLIFLITLNKIVYFPLLFLLIPVETKKFNSVNQKWFYVITATLICIIIIFWWSKVINNLIYPDPKNLLRTTYRNMNPGVEINPTLQMQHLLQNPLTQFFILVEQSYKIFLNRTTSSWVGTFGMGCYMPSGLSLVFFFLALLYTSTGNNKFKVSERIILVLLGFGMTMLFILSQHLHWDGVGDYFSSGYLGKYFIPIFPLFFWSVSGLFTVNQKIKKIITVSMLLLLGFVYIDFWILIYQRFYL